MLGLILILLVKYHFYGVSVLQFNSSLKSCEIRKNVTQTYQRTIGKNVLHFARVLRFTRDSLTSIDKLQMKANVAHIYRMYISDVREAEL
ncbi:hypothetical protein KC19_1G186800 [Ceratodon purpureus]|uniref:Uncharacterized protein n=1 Tax=Ceratodon purpureus TaxID=3225 RepID=A0A8T0J7U2_CERPU|nr:hypothetical protein KC19_1G186800 [Ceratodon purpureus]